MEAAKNLRSVLLSELPPKEKDKFFKFLLENEVQFTEDEQGYFVAIIRLVNPTSAPDQSRLLQDTVSFKQKRSSTPTPQETSMSTRAPSSRSKTPRPKTPTPDMTRYGDRLSDLFQEEAALNTRALGGEVLEFKKLVQAEKPKPSPLQVFLENTQFPALIEALKITAQLPLRPKNLSLLALIRLIEEVYSAKYKKDMSEVKASDQTFAEFVAEYFISKYRTQQLVQQQALDFMQSLESHETQSAEARMCSAFLQGSFSGEDLVFFLFLRATIEKELKILFTPKYPGQKTDIADTRQIALTLKQCSRVTDALLGSSETQLTQRLLVEVERELSFKGRGEGTINLARFMELMLQEYHSTQMPTLPHIIEEPTMSPYDQLKFNCSNHAEKTLAPQFISIILSGFKQLTPAQLSVLKVKAQEFLAKRMKALIEAAFGGNKLKWLELLGISTAHREALSHVEALQKKIREATRQSNAEDIDSICKMVLQTPELRTEMGRVMSKLSQDCQSGF
mmetsp:Transcript_13972/g.26160  ORF Transcript_13972/g.26160 Transcript_13972/m.26160 type:complete len:507 (-) Transcript_13972:872-2392(-)